MGPNRAGRIVRYILCCGVLFSTSLCSPHCFWLTQLQLTASQYQLFNRINSIYTALSEGLKNNQSAPTAKLLLAARSGSQPASAAPPNSLATSETAQQPPAVRSVPVATPPDYAAAQASASHDAAGSVARDNTPSTAVSVAPPAVPKKPVIAIKAPTVLARLRVQFDFDASEPGELSLRAGQLIEVYERHGDSDWWSGSSDGGRTTGLFPRNFCEEIADGAGAVPPAQPPPQQPQAPTAADNERQRQQQQQLEQQRQQQLELQQQQQADDERRRRAEQDARLRAAEAESRRQAEELQQQQAALEATNRAQQEAQRRKKEARLSMRPGTASALFTVTAMFEFPSVEAGDLAFRQGDVIEVLDNSEGEWWQGRLRGNVGLFPSNFTKINQTVAEPASQKVVLQTRIAAFDFDATEPGELSFKEGDRILVLDIPAGTEWWLGEREGGVRGLFPSNFTEPLN
eukprot:TRINITY_DN2576_c0_g1_i2.p1 TRINITY_DN2576_c0_g1~~TRINITY_DN2576_c0_g1_i2.p1  ORF type:complete len:458 (-),score=108.16 TRINITY_DN2576_c0_g1_i2:246-1619(-)